MADTEKKVQMSFLALDPFLETNIVSPKEQKVGGKDYMLWGDRNQYPEYLRSLYDDAATLHSVILGATDYVAGNGATCKSPLRDGRYMNSKGQTAHEIVRACAFNKVLFGGFALQVLRNQFGQVTDIYPINVSYLRSDKDNELFWYSENWGAKTGTSIKAIQYPKFIPNGQAPASIVYVKGDVDSTYPQPVWAAAVKSCEVERSIDDFHLNNINNGFMGSYLVNFCNGMPTDEEKKQIEKDFNEKFSGHQNAGRIVYNFAFSKENAAYLQKMEISDYGEKYETLSKHCRQEVFTAFRATPNLFGMNTENNGFNSEEYEFSFKLFNRTFVRPIQQQIVYAFDRILGTDGSLVIDPFSINDADTNVQ